MFSIQHIAWLLIAAAAIAAILILYEKKKPPLRKVLSAAIVVSLISEFIKVFARTVLVPYNGEMVPYLSLDYLPLHLCYVQVFFFLYARFTRNEDRRESVLAYLYPTTTLGGLVAMLLPNVFRTGVSPEQAFTKVASYQFFLYHTILIAVGLIIMRSGEIRWRKRHLLSTLIIFFSMIFVTFYLNSIFSSPHYVDGKLVGVDFSVNFFYTYNDPFGFSFTELWQWYIYLFVTSAFAALLIFILYVPFIFKRKADKEASSDKNGCKQTDVKTK